MEEVGKEENKEETARGGRWTQKIGIERGAKCDKSLIYCIQGG